MKQQAKEIKRFLLEMNQKTKEIKAPELPTQELLLRLA